MRSHNPHSAPLIDPQFLSEPHDLQRLRDGVRQSLKILAQHADTLHHPADTSRMGQDPLAVVDAQMRVHDVPGMRVVDTSVMPRIVSGNTNAPTIMIAEKAADWIRAAHWCFSSGSVWLQS